PPEIQRLVNTFLHQPERIEIAPQSTAAATIVQRLKKAPDDAPGKREAMRALMRASDVKNAIIFCNRKKDVSIVHRSLLKHGFNVGALHGDMDQHQRTATLESFRNGTIAFLAASDVAARGLDIPDVSHIFNYDVPIHPEDYIHRIGRTGRAGREGFAATLVTPRDFKALKAIERMLNQEIPWIDGAPEPQEAGSHDDERSNGRRRRGPRSKSRHGGGKGGEAPKSHPPRSAQPPRHAQHQKAQGHAGQRRDQGERRPPQQSAPAKQAPAHHKAAQEAKQHPAPKPAGRPHGKERGMGDHVPAFMTRPVRVP
ncbi:MAG: helicase-related protein, partial [Methyloceanibacter sp.]